jgi:2-dehydro-3-deoxygluconokinase
MKPIITFGELMMRLHVPNGKRIIQTNSFEIGYSGAEANVAVLLARLGLPVKFITRLPENDFADAALNSLESHRVDTSDIIRGGQRLGLYFTEDGNQLRPSRVVYDRKNSSFATIAPGMIDWKNIFKNAGWFHWSGISPAVSQSAADVCKEAIAAAKQAGIPVSADFNYRSTLWDYGKEPSGIMPLLLMDCDIVVGDIDTAKTYFGISIQDNRDIEKHFINFAEELKKKLPSMESLAMSFRGKNELQQLTYSGALMKDGKYFFSKKYDIPQITDRLGTGDAFNAGLIFNFIHQTEGQSMIDFATACGVLKHSIAGDLALISRDEIEQFTKIGPRDRVIR